MPTAGHQEQGGRRSVTRGARTRRAGTPSAASWGQLEQQPIPAESVAPTAGLLIESSQLGSLIDTTWKINEPICRLGDPGTRLTVMN